MKRLFNLLLFTFFFTGIPYAQTEFITVNAGTPLDTNLVNATMQVMAADAELGNAFIKLSNHFELFVLGNRFFFNIIVIL